MSIMKDNEQLHTQVEKVARQHADGQARDKVLLSSLLDYCSHRKRCDIHCN